MDPQVDKLLGSLTIDEKIGQLFISHVYGATGAGCDARATALNQHVFGVDDARGLVKRYHVGGLIYYRWAGNLHDPQQIAGLSNDIQDAASVGVLIGTDQEAGRVSRVGAPFTQLPGSMAVAATRSCTLAYHAGRIVGTEMRAVGINQVYAPVCDVLADASNVAIGTRSFGEDPRLVADLSAANMKGLQENVSAAAKHFPGHGNTVTDSHEGLPVSASTTRRWHRVERLPFQRCIDDGVDAVMTAHISVPALDPTGLPATLSRAVLTGVLRRELGFEGVVITDALDMGAVVRADQSHVVAAMAAGADMLAKPYDLPDAITAVRDAVASGEITEARIDTSVARILTLKANRGILGRQPLDLSAIPQHVGTYDHAIHADEISGRSVTLISEESSLREFQALLDMRVLVLDLCQEEELDIADHVAVLLGQRGIQAVPISAPIDGVLRGGASRAPVIVISQRGWHADNAHHRTLVNALAARHHVALVLASEPYGLDQFTGVGTCLAVYSPKPTSLAAAVDVLTGRRRAVGRLPVHLATARGDRDEPDR